MSNRYHEFIATKYNDRDKKFEPFHGPTTDLNSCLAEALLLSDDAVTMIMIQDYDSNKEPVGELRRWYTFYLGREFRL